MPRKVASITHTYGSTGAAYDASQTGEVADGDVLLIPSERVIGVAHTWPVAVTEAHGALHTLESTASPEAWAEDDAKLLAGWRAAVSEARRRGYPLGPSARLGVGESSRHAKKRTPHAKPAPLGPARSKAADVLVYDRPSGYWYAQAHDSTTGTQIADASGYSREDALRTLRGKFAMIGVAIKSITDEDPYAPGHSSHGATKKSSAQLDREIAEALGATSGLAHATIAPGALPSPRDVTAALLRDASHGPGKLVQLVASARPPRDVRGSPTLVAVLDRLRSQHDRTMGFISKPLAYSHAMPRGKREHANLIRLIKGGYVKVREVNGPSPEGSVARRDSPYGNERYYELYLADEG